MNRLNNNVKSLFESQELKTISQVIERFNDRSKKLEQVYASGEIPKHLNGLSNQLALLKILSNNDLYAIMNIGYYNACLEDNPLIFLDAFFTYSSLHFGKIKLLDSGVDHCGYFPSVVEHFAMNDFNKAKQIFNVELGMSTVGHTYAKCITNLIMGMLHNNKIIIDNAIINADKYLLGKNPAFDKASIEFLLYVIKNNFEKANAAFGEICKGYKKAK